MVDLAARIGDPTSSFDGRPRGHVVGHRNVGPRPKPIDTALTGMRRRSSSMVLQNARAQWASADGISRLVPIGCQWPSISPQLRPFVSPQPWPWFLPTWPSLLRITWVSLGFRSGASPPCRRLLARVSRCLGPGDSDVGAMSSRSTVAVAMLLGISSSTRTGGCWRRSRSSVSRRRHRSLGREFRRRRRTQARVRRRRS